MPIPFYYSFRNLGTRRLTTVLTASGMALVVFVFAATLMLAEGLQQTLVDTGSPDNVVVIRKGSESEVQSGVERSQAAIVESQPEVAIGREGRPLLAKELVVLINLPKRGSDRPANVVIRGIGPESLALRPQVRLAGGSDAAARVDGNRRGEKHRRSDSRGPASARSSISPCATGPSSAFSMPAAPASIPKSGGMWTSSCRPSAAPSIPPSFSGCATRTNSRSSKSGSKATRA